MQEACSGFVNNSLNKDRHTRAEETFNEKLEINDCGIEMDLEGIGGVSSCLCGISFLEPVHDFRGDGLESYSHLHGHRRADA